MEERASASFFAREVRAATDFYRHTQKWPPHGDDGRCAVEESLWRIGERGTARGVREKLGPGGFVGAREQRDEGEQRDPLLAESHWPWRLALVLFMM